MFHRLIVPLTLAALVVREDNAPAQGAFPAPLPNQAGEASPAPPVAGTAPASPFPSTGAPPIADVGDGLGASPGAAPLVGMSEVCRRAFASLREEAEKRGKLITEASKRRAPPDEACNLIASYSQAEVKMIEYAEANTAMCAIPPQIAEQLTSGHKGTEAMQTKVCNLAERKRRVPAGINDIGDPANGNDIGDPAIKPAGRVSERGEIPVQAFVRRACLSGAKT